MKTLIVCALHYDSTMEIGMKGQFIGWWTYLNPLMDVLKDHSLLHVDTLGSEINPAKRSEKDYRLLMYFYNKILNRDIERVPY